MRFERSATTVSWIPSEAITNAAMRMPFEVGLSHYDPPPPDRIDDVDALLAADRARFVNRLSCWIEVQDGRIVDAGHSGRGSIGSTTMRVADRAMTFAAVALPDRQHLERTGDSAVRFVQSAGGRTGVPAPRRIPRPPYVQLAAPLAWTTLAVTLHADGRHETELLGASPFPRHWIYDHDGSLHSKSGVIDFRSWWQRAFADDTPWGGANSEAVTTLAETALERELSQRLMRGAATTVERRHAGDEIVRQGDRGTDVFVVLDGIVRVERDGEVLAEIGPGAVLGERSALEGGLRTASLIATTRCVVARAPAADLPPDHLERLAAGHRREDDTSTG